MFTVKIMNEFIHSPLWIYDEDSIIDEPEFIANDARLQDLCNKVENMFSSYYEFDSHNEPCWFNHEKEKAEKITPSAGRGAAFGDAGSVRSCFWRAGCDVLWRERSAD